MRRSISAVGTGGDVSSYSLQYLQARLHRRIGMICAAMGWLVDARAFAARLNSRAFRAHSIRRLLHVGARMPMALRPFSQVFRCTVENLFLIRSLGAAR